MVMSDAIDIEGLNLCSLKYSPDGRYLGVGTSRTVEIRRASDLSLVHMVRDIHVAMTLAWHPQSEWLAVGTRGWNGRDYGSNPLGEKRKARVHLIDPKEGKIIRTLHGAIQDFYALEVSPDGSLVAGGGAWDTKLFVWDLDENDELTMLDVSLNISDLAFVDDRRLLVVGGDPRNPEDMPYGSPGTWLVSVDLKGGEVTRISLRGDPDRIAADRSRRSEYIVLCGYREWRGSRDNPDNQWLGLVHRIRAPDVEVLESYQLRKGTGAECDEISPDGRLVVYSGALLDLERRKELGILRGHYRSVPGASFSPDGKFVATGGSEGNIFVWSVEKILEEGLE